MKRVVFLASAFIVSATTYAADASQILPPGYFESNVPHGMNLPHAAPPPQSPAPSAPVPPTRQQVCIYEAGLLQKIASMRDIGVAERDARKVIAEDLRRERSYTPEFRNDIDGQLDWIYDHNFASQDGIRMAHLKRCDPKTFNWY